MNKALKYVIIFILSICFGGLMVVLFLPKSFEFSHEIEVNKPIEYCWDYYRNDENRTEWTTNFDGVEYIEGEKGAEGSTKNIYYKEDTTRVRILETIKEVDSPFHYKFEQEYGTPESPLMLMTTEVRLEAKDSVTTIITSNVDAKSENKFFGLLMFGMKKEVKKQQGINMDKLKTLIEKGGLETRLLPSNAKTSLN